MKSFKLKLSKRRIARYYLILYLLISITLFGYSTMYLYQYVYQTIYNYDEIARQFQSAHKTAEINIIKFEAITDNIESKRAPNVTSGLITIF